MGRELQRIAVLLLTLAWVAAGPARAQEADPAEVEDLVAELAERDDHVRKVAHDALVKMGAPAVPVLVGLLRTAAPRQQARICRVLRDIGPQAKGALDFLKELAANSDDKGVAFAARNAASAIDPSYGKPPPGAGRKPRMDAPEPGPLAPVDELIDRLISARTATFLNAIRDLGEHGESAAKAVPALTRILGSDAGDEAHTAVARTLERIGPAAEPAAPRLIALAAASKPPLSYRCRDALAAIGGTTTFPLLERLANDPAARGWAPEVLWELGAEAVPAVMSALRGGDAGLELAAVEALGCVGATDAEAAVPALVARLSHEKGGVRRAAAIALGRIGAPAKPALSALSELASDPKRRAQRDAVRAMTRIASDLARDRNPRRGRSRKLDRAIDAALDWLVRHQDVRTLGRWDAAGFAKHDPEDDRCTGGGRTTYDTGITALAVIPLLTRSTWVRRSEGAQRYGDAIRAALRFILSTQTPDGWLGTPATPHNVYNHAIGTIALCRAWAESRNPQYGEAAQRALDALERHRHPDLAWRYEPRSEKSDTSVTVWCVWALREGQAGGLLAAGEAFEGALEWLALATDLETGRTGYMGPGRPARPGELLARFPPERSESTTAAALHARLIVGERKEQEALLEKGFGLLLALPPEWSDGRGTTDFYYWYHGTYACLHRAGTTWSKWSAALKKAVLPRQRPDGSGALAGSWDPSDPWAGDLGRVGSTALLVQCLMLVNGLETRGRTAPTMDGPVRGALKALNALMRDDHDEVVRREAARAVAVLHAAY
jgi:HEAT repeat protein